MCGDSPETVAGHIGDPAFGRGDEYERFIDAILDVKTLDKPSRHLILTELYETIYGLKNHVNPEDSLGVASYKESINPEKVDPLKRHLSDYADLKINELYGLSLVEYLQQPPNVLRTIRKAAAEIRKDETRAVKQLNEQLKEGTNE